jgi:glutathione S-transferase
LTNKPDWFLALNPRGQVPTLEFDDGRILAESLIVSDYLDEIGDSSKVLHPKCSYQKAKDRLLVERFNLVRIPRIPCNFAPTILTKFYRSSLRFTKCCSI